MATKEIRLAHDRGHEEQMREILDLAGTDAFDVHWYPRPGGHAHGGIVLAPEHVADAWVAKEDERKTELERQREAEAAQAEPDEEFEEAEAAEAEDVTGTEDEDGEEPEPEPVRPVRSPRKTTGAKAAPEGDGSQA